MRISLLALEANHVLTDPEAFLVPEGEEKPCILPPKVSPVGVGSDGLQDLPEYLAAPLNLAVEKLDDCLALFSTIGSPAAAEIL